MDVQTVVANALGANQSVFINKVLDGLADADLATCPIAGANVFKKPHLQGVKHADARI
jgi:hypothetical protein